MNRLRSLLPDRAILLTALLGLANILVGYWTYAVSRRTTKLKRKTEQFNRLGRQYILAHQKSKQPAKQNEPENLLSYLEAKAPAKDLAELTPAGRTEDDRQLVRLKLESTSLREGLNLLSELEREGRVHPREVTLERISMESKNFDVYFQIAGKK